MTLLFYIAAGVAVVATGLAVTRLDAVHALLYLIVSFLAVAAVFFGLGAPFIAALEVIIYAGAIMVLFIFVVMMLNLGPESVNHERRLIPPRHWIGPAVLAAILAVEYCILLMRAQLSGPPAFTVGQTAVTPNPVAPATVGITLLGPYVLGVELASFLLLAGIAGAWHLGRKRRAVASEPESPPAKVQEIEPVIPSVWN